jgi:hypothetical protein
VVSALLEHRVIDFVSAKVRATSSERSSDRRRAARACRRMMIRNVSPQLASDIGRTEERRGASADSRHYMGALANTATRASQLPSAGIGAPERTFLSTSPPSEDFFVLVKVCIDEGGQFGLSRRNWCMVSSSTTAG